MNTTQLPIPPGHLVRGVFSSLLTWETGRLIGRMRRTRWRIVTPPPGSTRTILLEKGTAMSTHTTQTKCCSKCKQVKPLDAFGVETRRPDGRRCFCCTCGQANDRRYRATSQKYKDRHKRFMAKNRRRIKLWEKYKIREGEYHVLLLAQGGMCGICHTREPGGRWGKHFHVDHDHQTGRIRGLLCNSCNRGLAYFGDSVSGIKGALDYLNGQGF